MALRKSLCLVALLAGAGVASARWTPSTVDSRGGPLRLVEGPLSGAVGEGQVRWSRAPGLLFAWRAASPALAAPEATAPAATAPAATAPLAAPPKSSAAGWRLVSPEGRTCTATTTQAIIVRWLAGAPEDLDAVWLQVQDGSAAARLTPGPAGGLASFGGADVSAPVSTAEAVAVTDDWGPATAFRRGHRARVLESKTGRCEGAVLALPLNSGPSANAPPTLFRVAPAADWTTEARRRFDESDWVVDFEAKVALEGPGRLKAPVFLSVRRLGPVEGPGFALIYGKINRARRILVFRTGTGGIEGAALYGGVAESPSSVIGLAAVAEGADVVLIGHADGADLISATGEHQTLLPPE